ncbi:MAG: hypothetical protein RL339_1362 [Pseudomonadota bacterium]|jgi:hypothetical protein
MRMGAMTRLLAGAALLAASVAGAQDQAAGQGAQPVPQVVPYELPDPSTLTMPKVDFTPTPADEADFDKYFYFHRDGTGFAEAYTDVRECDALASGSSIYLDGGPAMAGAMANYGVLAAGIGSAVGGLIADAIFGSAARRQQRRINLRNCMGFKGYQRYGLTGDLWKDFNFEEGHGRKKEGERDDALEIQALVASGPKPKTKELGL